jgi:hypothetical protein
MRLFGHAQYRALLKDADPATRVQELMMARAVLPLDCGTRGGDESQERFRQ